MREKEFLFIVISSFILSIIWIASNVYHKYATSTIDSLLQIQILPITPEFDMETIKALRLRTPVEPVTNLPLPSPIPSLSPSDEEDISISPTVSPTESITPSPTSEESP